MASLSTQALLCLDFGNTRVKWALFDGRASTLKAGAEITAHVESLGVSDWLTQEVFPWCVIKPEAIAVSSVRGHGVVDDCRGFALRMGLGFLNPVAQAVGQVGARLVTAYQNPAALGQDRWSACYAVACQTDRASNLVVSFGTATTVDAVVRLDSDHSDGPCFLHLGGFIAPGVATMLQSLHQQTAQLPLASVCQTDWPTSTTEAIGAGVFESQYQLIQAARNRLAEKNGQSASLWLTGGSTDAFVGAFDPPVTVLSDAVLFGLFSQFHAQPAGRCKP